MKYMTLNIDSH